MIREWLRKLVGAPASPHRPSGDAYHTVCAALRAEARPCIRLEAANDDLMIGTRLGGAPPIAGRFDWPFWKGRPLSFLGVVELAEVQRALPIDWLPPAGRLLFFYDLEQETWGFDPADKGSAIVLFDPKPIAAKSQMAPSQLPEECRFSQKRLSALAATSYPSLDRLGEIADDLDYDLMDVIEAEFRPKAPLHQIAGFPIPIQNDCMELKSQLASNGIYVGEPEGYDSVEAQALKDGADDWHLLLQLDSDDDVGMMWGDVGMLYFWIRRQDAMRNDFSNVWMVLQCC